VNFKSLFFGFLLLSIIVSSCKSDDSDYTPLDIETEADFVQVLQNDIIEINVFLNDSNIPTEGVLTTSAARQGTVEVTDPNNTPNNPSDDIVVYRTTPNFTGEDVFEYTICTIDNSICKTNTVTVTVLSSSEVVFNIAEMPYPKLSDYNFFEGNMAEQNPNTGIIPYAPISSLFSDYALKKRFIWMPNNTIATYNGDHSVLELPVGAIIIKAFYYNNVQPSNTRKNIETRLMIRKETGWVFATYVWNESQTEAFFDLSGSFTEVEWLQEGELKTVNYRIPAESQCLTCHEAAENSIPIGIKPQNLNTVYSYPEGTSNQLDKLVEVGYLEDAVPSNINTVVDWKDVSQSLEMRMRSYVDINCAHCHADERYCEYRPMRFQFDLTSDVTNLGVCVDPDTTIPPNTKIVVPGNKDESVLYFRVNTTEEQYRMPLLGRTLIHEEYVTLVEEWINSLSQTCD
jgi:uncharacterized repeat protein (TIGR03806 family)